MPPFQVYKCLLVSVVCIFLLTACTQQDAGPPPYGLIIHGGAGSGTRAAISPQLETEMRAAMNAALASGYAVLENGGSSLDAVTASIIILEDAPQFNAGKGAVFNAVGGHELDASIMDGRTLNAGAVAGVRTIRNPITLARAVMEQSEHVMMAGEGAQNFARTVGIEQVSPNYFDTGRRRKQLDNALRKSGQRSSDQRKSDQASREQPDAALPSGHFGTVGVVALDQGGNLAAGTSTGGMTAKRFGRVGDSPIIGAGTYANNESCAVSSTGHGEYFIRHVVAHSICMRMANGAMTLKEAAEDVIMRELVEAKGTGGVVAMDAQGNIAWPYNTASMIRAHQSRDRAARVLIFEK